MKKAVKVSMVAIVAIVGLSACSAPIDMGYTGDAVIEQAVGSKRNCTITITAEDGTKKSLLTSSAFDCYGLKKGSAVKVVNGKVQ